MDEKKVLKTIDEMLADPWHLYDSLYTYVLQKRQEDIINRPGFVI
ncbi:hypothetical protein [Lactiplantibacillus plantarum]|nr:hypothetical protein [Lactiplantibacillus plantarum]